MKKRKRKVLIRIYYSIVFILIFLSVIINLRLNYYQKYSKSEPEEGIEEQLNYLNDELKDGLANKMQSYFPEGFVFSNVIFGLAYTEYARYENISKESKNISIKRAEWALSQIQKQSSLKPFLKSKNLCPEYGIFYFGWKNYLRASILRVKENPTKKEIEDFKKECDYIYKCFSNKNNPYLETYNYNSWPADNLTAIASLSIHDKLFEPIYSDFINNWLDNVRKLIKNQTMIPHKVNSLNGKSIEYARGSSQSLIIRLLAEINLSEAKHYYNIFKNEFKTEKFGLPLIREYRKGVNKEGDIDSGPIIFNIGPVATIVTIGSSRAVGDTKLSDGLIKTTEFLGLPIQYNNKKFYAFGIQLIGDIFLCWSKTTYPLNTINQNYSIGKQILLLNIFIVLILLIPIFIKYIKRYYEK